MMGFYLGFTHSMAMESMSRETKRQREGEIREIHRENQSWIIPEIE